MAIPVSLFPTEEREAAFYLNRALLELTVCYDQFTAAVALFDHALGLAEGVRSDLTAAQDTSSLEELGAARDSQRTYRQWLMIAARDGAITVYNFWQGMGAISSWLGKCPTVRSTLDHTQLRAARKRFNDSFPRAREIRLAVSHRAELLGQEPQVEKHAVSGDVNVAGIHATGVKRFTVSDALENRTYTVTAEGSTHSYQITQRSLAELGAVRDAFEVAFVRVTESRAAR